MAKQMLRYGMAYILAGVMLTSAVGVSAQEVAHKPIVAAPAKPVVVAAKKQVSSRQFVCPDLQNTEKLTIDPMVQGKDGWFFRPGSDLQMEFAIMDEGAEYMARLARALKSRGTTLVFISVPSRGVIGYPWLDTSDATQAAFIAKDAMASYQSRLGVLNKIGVISPDMLQSVAGSNASDAATFFFKRDHHWTSLGARAAAEAVAEALKANEVFKAQKPKSFETKEIAKGEMKHTMSMEIQRLCQGEVPAEPFPLFETTSKADDADALFGDEEGASPSILIGSSFSANKQFNFEGFLMQYTGLDIANYAVSGGMLFNALVSLSNNPAFETMKPPFMFWEAPSIYDFNSDSATAFRQVIPGVYGACKDEQAVARGTLSIAAGKGGVLLQVPAQKKAHGTGYYLVIDSSSRALTKFTIEMDYDDDDGEWFIIDRTQFFDNTGRFFLELSDEIDSNLVTVNVNDAGNTTGTLTAKLCPIPASATKVSEVKNDTTKSNDLNN